LRTGFIFQTAASNFQGWWPRIPYPLVLSLKKRELHNSLVKLKYNEWKEFSQTKVAKHYAPSTQQKALTCQWVVQR
jgi:hypothetical protein